MIVAVAVPEGIFMKFGIEKFAKSSLKHFSFG
jgi:hypothetical protein